MAEGVFLFVDYLFGQWTFRKLYGEVIDANLSSFESALTSLLVEEGRLKDHTYMNGRYHDLRYLALYRDTWEKVRDRYLKPSPDDRSDDG